MVVKSGWYQNQGGSKTRVVPKSGWYQHQGGTKIRVVPTSGWYQNQVGTKIRVVPKSGWYQNQGGTNLQIGKSVHPKLALSANQSTRVGEFGYFSPTYYEYETKGKLIGHCHMDLIGI